MKIFYR